MGFSRRGYWNGLPFPSLGDLPNPEIKPRSPALQAYSLLSEPPGKPKNTRVGSLSLSPGDLPYPGVPCIESEVMKSLSHVQLFAIPWTVVYQASLSMGFSRQEYWSGLPCPSPRDLPDLGIELTSPAFQADSLLSEPPGKL